MPWILKAMGIYRAVRVKGNNAINCIMRNVGCIHGTRIRISGHHLPNIPFKVKLNIFDTKITWINRVRLQPVDVSCYSSLYLWFSSLLFLLDLDDHITSYTSSCVFCRCEQIIITVINTYVLFMCRVSHISICQIQNDANSNRELK